MQNIGGVACRRSEVANATVSVGHCKVLGMPASAISWWSNKPTNCTWQPSGGFPGGCPTVATIGRLICTSVNAMGPG